jgi:hypothetical protein
MLESVKKRCIAVVRLTLAPSDQKFETKIKTRLS